MDMKPILGTDKVVQICIVVKDAKEAGKHFAHLLGQEEPELCLLGWDEEVQTYLRGETVTSASAKIGVFHMGDLDLEVLQPGPGASVWREFLDAHGQGVHHIAYKIKDMEAATATMEGIGCKLLQKGLYGDKTGEYAYFDTVDQFGVTIELLRDF